jgi:transcriptional regulator with XRE-family HTH domain
VTITTGEEGHWRRSGENIRIAREAAGISVRELARRIEVSASHVSQVERGLASFSVPTLYRVAQELGISMDSLFEDPSKPRASADSDEEQRAAAGEVSLDEAGVIQRVESRPKLDLTTGLTWERLTSRVEINAEFIEVVYEPSVHASNPPSEVVRHVGREYGIIISGELTIQVGLSISVLTEGDSVAFDCSIPHRFWNATDKQVRAIWFISERGGASNASAAEAMEARHIY